MGYPIFGGLQLPMAKYIFWCPQVYKIMPTLLTLHEKTKASNFTFTASHSRSVLATMGPWLYGKIQRQFQQSSQILVVMDYFTKWVEAIPTKRAINKIVMEYLEEKLINCFRVPTKIIIDNVEAFSFIELSTFCCGCGFALSHSSNYYPQGNGLEEWSNKNLMTIIKKRVGDNKKN